MNSKSKTVSVIMPVFNAGPFLSQAVDSILNQSHSEIEFIIVNDGSSDNSLDILYAYQKQDSRVHVISQDNSGIVASLNSAIDSAEGDYIARMDADDISLPERIEDQLKHLEQTSADLCGTWVKTFGAGLSRIRKYYLSDSAIKLYMAFNSPFAHPTILAKSRIFKGNYYDRDYEYCEDLELWCRLANKNIKMSNLQKVELYYRTHAGQLSIKKQSAQAEHRAKISAKYLNSCPMGIKGADLSAFMVRSGVLDKKSLVKAVSALIDISKSIDDNEGILKQQCALFLLRHGGIDSEVSELIKQSRILTTTQINILRAIYFTGFNHDSKLWRLMSRFK